MKIGIIGSGNIGGTAAKLFANAGHDVAISNSRGPESLTSIANSIGANVTAKTVEDAIKFGSYITCNTLEKKTRAAFIQSI